MRVELTMFKPNGKWYSDGTYNTKLKNLFEIWDEVRQMRDKGNLPGLVKGANEFIVLVDVPRHEYRHPHIVI